MLDDCLVFEPLIWILVAIAWETVNIPKMMVQRDQNDILAAKKVDALSLSSIMCPSNNSITSASKLMAQLVQSFHQFFYNDLCKGPPLGRAIGFGDSWSSIDSTTTGHDNRN